MKIQDYDYDKTLKGQNKDIASITAQINSLTGATDQASQARLAKLQQQLKDAQEEQDDTIYNHSIEVQQSGYEKIAEDATEVLNDTLRELDGNQAFRDQIVQEELNRLNGHEVEAKDAITKQTNASGIYIGDKTQAFIDKYTKERTQQSSWESTLGETVSNINTSLIPTLNDTTKGILTTIQEDIDSAIGTTNSNLSNTETGLPGINTKMKELKTTFETEQKATRDAIDKAAKAAAENKAVEKKENTNAEKDVTSGSGSGNTGGGNGGSGGNTGGGNTGGSGSGGTTKTDDQKLMERYNQDNENVLKQNQIKNIVTQTGTKLSATDKKTYLATKGLSDVEKLIANKFGYKPGKYTLAQIALALGMKKSASGKSKITSQTEITTAANKKAIYKLMKGIGFRKGSHSTDDELNWLHDNEVIIRKSDGAILQPFNSGDMVFTSAQSENLWKLSKLSTEAIKQMVANPDMSKFITPRPVNVSPANNTNQSLHIDSLITINGNADQQTVADIREIAEQLVKDRDFNKNVTNMLTKNMTREAAKIGYRR